MSGFFTKATAFVKGLYKDPEIPKRDKVIFGVCLMLIVSPIDMIPDVIPVIGVIDDFILIATLLDYLFEVLDRQILLRHYPWSEKSLDRLKRWSKTITRFAPASLKNNIWAKASRIAEEKMANSGDKDIEDIVIDVTAEKPSEKSSAKSTDMPKKKPKTKE